MVELCVDERDVEAIEMEEFSQFEHWVYVALSREWYAHCMGLVCKGDRTHSLSGKNEGIKDALYATSLFFSFSVNLIQGMGVFVARGVNIFGFLWGQHKRVRFCLVFFSCVSLGFYRVNNRWSDLPCILFENEVKVKHFMLHMPLKDSQYADCQIKKERNKTI